MLHAAPAPFGQHVAPQPEPGITDRLRRQRGMRRSYANATWKGVQQRAEYADQYYSGMDGEANAAFRIQSPTKMRRPAHHNQRQWTQVSAPMAPTPPLPPGPPPAHTLLCHDDDFEDESERPPQSVTIAITDADLRRAFGHNLFQSPGIGYSEPAVMPPRVPSPVIVPSTEEVEADLESMKQLSLSEMMSVMRGADVPIKTMQTETRLPFSCPPTPILGAGCHPPLPMSALQFKLTASSTDPPACNGFTNESSSTC